MAKRKEKAPDGIVSTATELGLALYENTGRILIQGPLASAIYYGELCLRGIEIGIVLLFVCLFLSIYKPSVMLPFALICAGFIALCSLPVIFLRYIHVPLTLILRIKSHYKRVEFSSKQNKLFLKIKGKYRRAGTKSGSGTTLKRLQRQQEMAQQDFSKQALTSVTLVSSLDGSQSQAQAQAQAQGQAQANADVNTDTNLQAGLEAHNKTNPEAVTQSSKSTNGHASLAASAKISVPQPAYSHEQRLASDEPEPKDPADPLLESLEMSGEFSYAESQLEPQPADQQQPYPKLRPKS